MVGVERERAQVREWEICYGSQMEHQEDGYLPQPYILFKHMFSIHRLRRNQPSLHTHPETDRFNGLTDLEQTENANKDRQTIPDTQTDLDSSENQKDLQTD